MRREVHVKIAKALFKRLNLPKRYEKFFIRGITRPDELLLKAKRRRRYARRRHHYISSSVFDYVLKARLNYVKGDISSCLYNLGIALHFVQDAHIPPPGRRYRRKTHDTLERRIMYLPIPEDEITEGFNVSQSSPEFVKKIISEIKWTYEPELALRKAVRASAAITAAVFGPKEPPEDLKMKYMAAKEDHKKLTMAGCLVFLLGAVLGIFLGPLMFFLVIPGILILMSDQQFYRLREKAIWYGIEEY